MNQMTAILFALAFIGLELAEKNDLKGAREAQASLAIAFFVACVIIWLDVKP